MVDAVRDMVIVKILYEEKAHKGSSIYLPEQMKKYHAGFCGEVISVGPDYPYNIQPGDKVLFRRHEGKPIIMGDWEGEFFALKERWVEAKIHD